MSALVPRPCVLHEELDPLGSQVQRVKYESQEGTSTDGSISKIFIPALRNGYMRCKNSWLGFSVQAKLNGTDLPFTTTNNTGGRTRTNSNNVKLDPSGACTFIQSVTLLQANYPIATLKDYNKIHSILQVATASSESASVRAAVSGSSWCSNGCMNRMKGTRVALVYGDFSTSGTATATTTPVMSFCLPLVGVLGAANIPMSCLSEGLEIRIQWSDDVRNSFYTGAYGTAESAQNASVIAAHLQTHSHPGYGSLPGDHSHEVTDDTQEGTGPNSQGSGDGDGDHTHHDFPLDPRVNLDGVDGHIELPSLGGGSEKVLDSSHDWSCGLFLSDTESFDVTDNAYVSVISSGSKVIYLRRGGNNVGFYYSSLDGSQKNGANTWVNGIGNGPCKILFTYQESNNELKYYLDGTLRGTIYLNATDLATNPVGGPLLVGQGAGGLNWHGSINSVLLSDHVVTGPQITEFFSDDKITDSDLYNDDVTSWYNAGTDSYPEVHDEKGNSGNGELKDGNEQDFENSPPDDVIDAASAELDAIRTATITDKGSMVFSNVHWNAEMTVMDDSSQLEIQKENNMKPPIDSTKDNTTIEWSDVFYYGIKNTIAAEDLMSTTADKQRNTIVAGFNYKSLRSIYHAGFTKFDASANLNPPNVPHIYFNTIQYRIAGVQHPKQKIDTLSQMVQCNVAAHSNVSQSAVTGLMCKNYTNLSYRPTTAIPAAKVEATDRGLVTVDLQSFPAHDNISGVDSSSADVECLIETGISTFDGSKTMESFWVACFDCIYTIRGGLMRRSD